MQGGFSPSSATSSSAHAVLTSDNNMHDNPYYNSSA